MRGSSQRGGMHPSSRRLGLFRGIHSCAENGPIMSFIVHSHKKGVIKESVFIHSAALCLRMMSSLLEKFFALQPCESTEFEIHNL